MKKVIIILSLFFVFFIPNVSYSIETLKLKRKLIDRTEVYGYVDTLDKYKLYHEYQKKIQNYMSLFSDIHKREGGISFDRIYLTMSLINTHYYFIGQLSNIMNMLILKVTNKLISSGSDKSEGMWIHIVNIQGLLSDMKYNLEYTGRIIKVSKGIIKTNYGNIDKIAELHILDKILAILDEETITRNTFLNDIDKYDRYLENKRRFYKKK